MGIEITTKSIVTVSIHEEGSDEALHLRMDGEFPDYVQVLDSPDDHIAKFAVPLAELESAIKALKGEPTVGTFRKPGKIRVGDKVRVIDDESGICKETIGLVGTVTDTSYPYNPQYPIRVDFAVADRRESWLDFTVCNEREIEVIEEVK